MIQWDSNSLPLPTFSRCWRAYIWMKHLYSDTSYFLYISHKLYRSISMYIFIYLNYIWWYKKIKDGRCEVHRLRREVWNDGPLIFYYDIFFLMFDKNIMPSSHTSRLLYLLYHFRVKELFLLYKCHINLLLSWTKYMSLFYYKLWLQIIGVAYMLGYKWGQP